MHQYPKIFSIPTRGRDIRPISSVNEVPDTWGNPLCGLCARDYNTI